MAEPAESGRRPGSLALRPPDWRDDSMVPKRVFRKQPFRWSCVLSCGPRLPLLLLNSPLENSFSQEKTHPGSSKG